MSNSKKDFFVSNWGFLLTLIGTAIGAGNIWRFSRIVAQNGGGSFIIPWVIFLFAWSIPLIIAEIAMGKLTRKGPIGALATVAGPQFGWMGGFIALVCSGILFYYSVIVGWGFCYFIFGVTGKLSDPATSFPTLWSSYTNTYYPMLAHIGAILAACFIVYKGISQGIEKTNKILMPTLFVLIIILGIRAVTLPHAWEGIKYLFTPHMDKLLNWKVWMEALTQNAWDTGAGWGFFLVFACFAKKSESITINGALTALANNAVSLIMGTIIFATAFAIAAEGGIKSLIEGEGATNIGLAFIFLPRLFRELPGGLAIQTLFASIFFLAFFFAALSSMISMVQLTSHVLRELGLKKIVAVLVTGLAALVLGAPSALNIKFLENQDWVWGVGLIVSGLFIAFGVLRYGVDRYRREAVNSAPNDLKLGKFYNILIALVPIESIILLGWYFYESAFCFDCKAWWNPIRATSLGTVLLQWGLGIIILLILNRMLVERSMKPIKD